MTTYDNLKYARRAGSDVTLDVVVREAGPVETRGDIAMRRLMVSDGHLTLPLVLFGEAARPACHAGQRILAGPAYWSDQHGNFSLKRGGAVKNR